MIPQPPESTSPESQLPETVDWHSAFFEAIQLELAAYAECLKFEKEHALNREPFRIDILICKTRPEVLIQKNIAENFRKWNIVEYKSPGRSLTKWDYLKLTAYAGMYIYPKKLAEKDVFLTLIGTHHPRNLLDFLEMERGFRVSQTHPGIYKVEGDTYATQVLVSRELSEEDNIFIKNLGRDTTAEDFMKAVRLKEDHLYQDCQITAYIYARNRVKCAAARFGIRARF